MSSNIAAVYNPHTGCIGCVLLQAAGGGSADIAGLFETTDWELAPREGQKILQATEQQWQQLADMSRQERIDRWRQRVPQPKGEG